LSYHTVNSYLDYLTGAFVVRSLPPYFANLSKRLVKTPKLYWRDSGLLHALLNIKDATALYAHPAVGASWEGFVIEQILGVLQQLGARCDAFHMRTSDGQEIDLVLDFGSELWALEIKLSSSPGLDDMARLNKAADTIKARKRFLLSTVKRPALSDDRISCDLKWFVRNMPKWLPR
jgi:hypothetical protein